MVSHVGWGSWTSLATTVLVSLGAVAWSITQLVRSSGSFERYRQWTQIAKEADSEAVREYATKRADRNLLDYAVSRFMFWNRVGVLTLAVLLLLIWGIYAVGAWALGARGTPFEYTGLAAAARKMTQIRDGVTVFGVICMLIVGVSHPLSVRSARRQIAKALGLEIPRAKDDR